MPTLEAARGKVEKLHISQELLDWCGWGKGDYIHITPIETPTGVEGETKKTLELEKLND